MSPDRVVEDATSFEQRLDSWRRAWESLDHERYASHYSRRFRSDDKSYRAWMAHKKRVNSRKHFINVGLGDVSIFRYPGEDMVAVTFD